MNDSRWYYGVVLVMVLEAIGFILMELAVRGGLASGNILAVGTGLLGALIVLVTLLLLPVFCGCLFFDARATRDAAESWDPDPWLWAVGAFFLQVAAIAGGVSLYLLIGTWYLLRRFRSSPAAVADEEAWAKQEESWAQEGDDD
jgi:hypothetical protein